MGRRPKFLRVGDRYGRLTVVALAGQESATGKTMVHLRCDCGSVCFRLCTAVRQGKVASCGCLAAENGRYQGKLCAKREKDDG